MQPSRSIFYISFLDQSLSVCFQRLSPKWIQIKKIKKTVTVFPLMHSLCSLLRFDHLLQKKKQFSLFWLTCTISWDTLRKDVKVLQSLICPVWGSFFMPNRPVVDLPTPPYPTPSLNCLQVHKKGTSQLLFFLFFPLKTCCLLSTVRFADFLPVSPDSLSSRKT